MGSPVNVVVINLCIEAIEEEAIHNTWMIVVVSLKEMIVIFTLYLTPLIHKPHSAPILHVLFYCVLSDATLSVPLLL